MTEHRTLRRQVWPFARSEGALDAIALRLNATDEFDPAKTSFLMEAPEPGEVRPIYLDLRLRLDGNAIAQAALVPIEAVSLCLLLEHTPARTVERLAEWPITGVPPRWEHEVPPLAYSGSELRVRLSAVFTAPTGPHQKPSTAARRPGSILCDKAFAIRAPQSKSIFKVENTSFSLKGWEPAIYFLDITDPIGAMTDPPEDVLEVHLNKDLPSLQYLWTRAATQHGPATRVAANMIRKTVLASVLADMAIPVLAALCQDSKSEEAVLPPEPGSLAERLLQTLCKLLRLSQGALVTLANDRPGELRRRIQGAVGVARAFDQDALSALREVAQ